MDDLANKLKGLLDSPEGLEQIKSIAASFLGSSSDNENEKESHHHREGEHTKGGGIGIGDNDIQMIMKIKSTLDNFKGDDKKFELLYALKPHLRPSRQSRVDEAIKMMRLFNLMPLFKENGFL